MSRKLVKRVQKKAMGGTVYARVYDDGSIRIRTDHPSNDPAVEIAMAAAAIGAIRDSGRRMRIEYSLTGPLHWRDDPPATPTRGGGK